ncbi:ABC transporter permease [Cellvibrio zantedeschiae]|uniref:ABC transporter permease n=1 Tax=Cellvibrio zantedeschiae TaxID=1237077 RepID=A0ABQ3BA93_9GAMM|nr:ABC transporter permease [Cellvibrio zantedeschiae]GGY86284.1 ABC transporter permease [Cellvibrio zantedeschiae]
MFKNYLITTLRNLLKHKIHSALTIIGLAVGFAASAIIIIINYTEMNYDRHWENSDRIFQIESTVNFQNENRKSPFVYTDIYEIIKEKIPEIEHISRQNQNETKVRIIRNGTNNNEEFQEYASAVDNDFFEIFNYPIAKGSLKDFYTDESTTVITEELEKKLFGRESAIGKTINIETTNLVLSEIHPAEANSRPTTYKDFKIAAVIANSPYKTSILRQNIFIHLQKITTPEPGKGAAFSQALVMYVKVKPNANILKIQNRLPKLQDEFTSSPLVNGKKSSEIHLVSFLNIKDAHLKGSNVTGQIEKIWMLFGLAAIILLMASINYINLALAAYSRRQKEIALRKTLGASKKNIIHQFLSESLLIAILALLISLICIELCIPWLKSTVNLDIEISYTYAPQILGYLFTMALTVGLVSGAYPSFYLSQFNPAATLKSNKSLESLTSIRFRKGLVVSQFIISGVMITSVSIIATQMHKAQTLDPGYQTKNIIFATHSALSAANRGSVENIKYQISKIPGVQLVTLAMPSLPGKYGQQMLVSRQGNAPSTVIGLQQAQLAGPDDLKVFNIKLIAGKYFSAPVNTDENRSAIQNKIYINEQALAPLGFKNAEDAINQQIYVAYSRTYKMQMTIVGVTAAIHIGSFNAPDAPCFFWPISSTGMPIGFALRYEGNDRKAITESIKSIWKQSLGYMPHTWFIEDAIADEYKNENLIARFVYMFTGIAIFISCLGLYGLATHATNNRRKEIGLRKVHGASISNIVRLLLWQFSKPVLFANIVIWPIALYAGSRWLEQFINRINIWQWGPVFCLISALAALLIAWITVGGQALLVAREKPVHALREE